MANSYDAPNKPQILRLRPSGFAQDDNSVGIVSFACELRQEGQAGSLDRAASLLEQAAQP